MTTPAPAGSRAEGAIQVALMLAVGCVAGAASWAHVIDLANDHGQGGWLAYADAAVIETAAVSAGLEMRRRKRIGDPVSSVATVLFLAVGLQLAAQLAAAEKSGWGWVLGAVPAVFFLVLVKIGLSRTAAVNPGSVTDAASPVAVTEPARHLFAVPEQINAAFTELDREQARAAKREQKPARRPNRRTEQKPTTAREQKTEQKDTPTDEQAVALMRAWAEQNPGEQINRYRVEKVAKVSVRQANRVLSALTEQTVEVRA